MYKLTLGNGKVFADLACNGSYFVSKSPVTQEDFTGWGGKCRIEVDGENIGEWHAGDYQGLELIDIMSNGTEWFFALRALSAAELEALRTRGDVDYIAMMTGVTL